jgi:hypothetical protein
MLLENVEKAIIASPHAAITEEADQAAINLIPLSMRSKAGLEDLVDAIINSPGSNPTVHSAHDGRNIVYERQAMGVPVCEP